MRTLIAGWFVLGLLTFAGAAGAATVDVEVGKDLPPATMLAYFPDTVVVNEGDTVAWRTASHEPHSVTQFPEGAGSFDSSPDFDHMSPIAQEWFAPGGLLLAGQSFRHTFDEPGEYAYFCMLHNGMEGTVRVVAATTDGALPAEGAAPAEVLVAAGWGAGPTVLNRFGPSEVTIEQGTTVVWTNMATTEPHTVTGAPPNMDAPPGPGNEFSFDSSPKLDFSKVPDTWFSGDGGLMSLPSPDSEGPPSKQTFSHKFTKAGTYQYFCKLHPEMWGTVVVLPKAPAGTTGTTGGSGSGSGTGGASGATNTVPGLELPALLAGLGAAALLVRRR